MGGRTMKSLTPFTGQWWRPQDTIAKMTPFVGSAMIAKEQQQQTAQIAKNQKNEAEAQAEKERQMALASLISADEAAQRKSEELRRLASSSGRSSTINTATLAGNASSGVRVKRLLGV